MPLVLDETRAQDWQESPREIHDAISNALDTIKDARITAFARAKNETRWAEIDVHLETTAHHLEIADRRIRNLP